MNTRAPTPRSRLRAFAEPALAAVVFSVASLGITWPLATQLGSRVLGSHRGDLWFHVWGLWWMKASLLGHGRFPLHTDQVNYPDGGTLLLIDPLNGLLSIPLQAVLPLAAAYNLTVLLDMVLACMGAWLLVRWLIRQGRPQSAALLCPGALLAGLIFGTCPHLLGAVENGVSETFHLWLSPVFVYALMRALYQRSYLAGVASGLLLALSLFANAYYGVFCGLLALLVVGWMALAQRGVLFRWRNLGVLASAVVAFALPAVPWIRLLTRVYAAPDALIRRAPDPGTLENVIAIHRFVVDLSAFFTVRSPGQHAGAYHTNVIYLGYAALGLFVLGCLVARRQRLLWLAVFVVFFVLSWGPALKVGGDFVMRDGGYVQLPFYYLFTRTPYLSLVSHPHRLTAVTMLPLAVMAGMGVGALAERLRHAWIAGVVALIASGAVLAETLMLAPNRIPISSSPAASPDFYHQLAQDTDSYGIVVLPISFAGMDQRRVYFYDQAVHHKKLPNMVDRVATDFTLRNAFLAHLYFLEWRADTRLNQPYQGPRSADHASPEQLQAGLDALAAADFRYLVLDEAHFVPSQASAVAETRSFLEAWLGEPEQHQPGFSVWSLPAAP